MSRPVMRGAVRARPPGARTRIPRSFASLALAAELVLGCLAGCGEDGSATGGPGGEEGGGPPPAAVEVLSLERERFQQRAALLGELRSVESVVVKSEIAGVIGSIDFEEGQAVTKGAVLFQLRDDEQQARLHEAEARRALAEDEFVRTQRLASLNAAAEIQLERDRAELAVARAREERRRVELERTRIRAPFDGLVGVRQISPGARVTPDDPLVRIDAVDPMELAFTIPEAVLPLAKIGATFELEVAPWPGRKFPGEISFVAPSVDSATRRILIKGRVPNPEHLLLPGLFATVEAELGEREAFLVPEEAVITDPEGFFVWRIGPDDGAERVPVEVGGREGGRVEIRAELRPGDRIVTAGTHKVRAGEKVTPVAAAGSKAAPSGAAAAAGERGGA